MKGNCSFPFIRQGQLCLLPLVTSLLGLGLPRAEKPLWRAFVEAVETHLNQPQRGENSLPLINAEEVTPEEVTWLWKPYLPKGMLTAIDGDPGVGKSFLGLAIAAALSRGQTPGLIGLMGLRRTPQRTIWCTGEEDVAKAIIPRLNKIGADLHYINIYNGLAEDQLMLSHLEGLEHAIQEWKPALVVLDPLIAFMEADANMNSANAMKQALKNLEQLMQTYETACILMRHLSKDTKSRAIYRGLNSVAFAATFRSMLLIDHDPTKEAEPGITHAVMAHSKSSYEAKGASLTYTLDAQGFTWKGISQLTANQLNNPSRSLDKLAEAKEFLHEYLKDGPQLATNVQDAAAAHGISKATLRRAREEEGIKPDKGEGAGAAWVWQLPVKIKRRLRRIG